MADKKDRGRFTLRLNEKDPAHAEVIRLLEQQDPHSKGRFIVNAVLHYVHCSETPDISVGKTFDRTMLEDMIQDILRQQGMVRIEPEPGLLSQKQERFEENKKPRPDPETLETITEDAEQSTKALIQDTLSAFRNSNG